MSDTVNKLKGRQRALAEKIKGLRGRSFTWSQVSRQLGINIIRAKELLHALLTESERAKSKRDRLAAQAMRPDQCRYRVRRNTVWQDRCANNLGPCICQLNEGKF